DRAVDRWVRRRISDRDAGAGVNIEVRPEGQGPLIRASRLFVGGENPVLVVLPVHVVWECEAVWVVVLWPAVRERGSVVEAERGDVAVAARGGVAGSDASSYVGHVERCGSVTGTISGSNDREEGGVDAAGVGRAVADEPVAVRSTRPGPHLDDAG